MILDRRVRVFVLADIRLYREALAQAIARSAGLELVGAGPPDSGGLESVQAKRPDVVVVDGSTAHQTNIVREISGNHGARVVAYGIVDQADQVIGCAEAGVAGFLPREASLEEMVTGILSVAQGEGPCPPRIAAMLLRRVAAAAGQVGLTRDRQLTYRERQIVTLVDRGLSNKEIGKQLGIEVSTVKNHVHHLLEKLGAGRRGEAAARARRALLGLTPFCGHAPFGEEGVHDATGISPGVSAADGRAGRTPKALAQEFERSEQAIRNCIKQGDLDSGRRTDGLTSEEQAELRRLRRENQQLKLEREILRKAAALDCAGTKVVPDGDSNS